MSGRSRDKPVPRYQGTEWLKVKLPRQTAPWLDGKHQSLHKRRSSHAVATAELNAMLERNRWKWPRHPIYFFADPHADTDAMLASLVASGGIRKTGPDDRDFELTGSGKRARFIIGGDCFDKGPSSLRLLRALRSLAERGASLRILAGNHDVRVMLGMRNVGVKRKLENEHFFIRMGPKAVPLLKEIQTHYLQGRKALRHIPGKRTCRQRLYPSERWFNDFVPLAGEPLWRHSARTLATTPGCAHPVTTTSNGAASAMDSLDRRAPSRLLSSAISCLLLRTRRYRRLSGRKPFRGGR